MEISNSIAAMSVNMNTAQLQQDVSISMLKKSMDAQESSLNGILSMAPNLNPALGKSIDVSA